MKQQLRESKRNEIFLGFAVKIETIQWIFRLKFSFSPDCEQAKWKRLTLIWCPKYQNHFCPIFFVSNQILLFNNDANRVWYPFLFRKQFLRLQRKLVLVLSDKIGISATGNTIKLKWANRICRVKTKTCIDSGRWRGTSRRESDALWVPNFLSGVTPLNHGQFIVNVFASLLTDGFPQSTA